MCEIRVMTFNIRADYAKDGINDWSNRAVLNVKTIKHYLPNLIGFQELQDNNLKTYQQLLGEYKYILGPEYRNKQPYNYNAIFFNPSVFEMIDSGGFWLSKTPEVYSSDWEAFETRSATWVKLRSINTDEEFLLLNTHLDHKSELARVQGSKLILEKTLHLQADNLPLVITGDFNSNPGSSAYRIFMENSFVDTYLIAGNEDSEESNTNHSFKGKQYLISECEFAIGRIDWILTRDGSQHIRTKSCVIIHDAEPPLYPSDHYPVLAELRLTSQRKFFC